MSIHAHARPGIRNIFWMRRRDEMIAKGAINTGE